MVILYGHDVLPRVIFLVYYGSVSKLLVLCVIGYCDAGLYQSHIYIYVSVVLWYRRRRRHAWVSSQQILEEAFEGAELSKSVCQ